ncbi:hypothetical protein [Ralstonia pseudosolanacearum]|uniref:hypothetical protein n=1 Tax=Ralstonia pseudosolanacearum TaxID=1310165 RepID=UPI003CEFF180
MDILDVVSLTLLMLAIADLALLLSNGEGKIDWALRIVMATSLAIAALLIHQRDFNIPYLFIVTVLTGICQSVLLWRRAAEVRRDGSNDASNNQGDEV